MAPDWVFKSAVLHGIAISEWLSVLMIIVSRFDLRQLRQPLFLIGCCILVSSAAHLISLMMVANYFSLERPNSFEWFPSLAQTGAVCVEISSIGILLMVIIRLNAFFEKASLTRRILTRAAAFTNVLHLITLVLGFMSWQYGEDGSSSVYFNYWVLGIAVSQVFGAIINISAALSFVNHILMQLQMRTRRSWYHIVSDSHGNRLLVTVAINFYLLYSIILPMVDRSKQLSAIASHMGPWATLCEFCVFVSSSYSFTERMLRKRDDGFEKELKSIFRSTIQQS